MAAGSGRRGEVGVEVHADGAGEVPGHVVAATLAVGEPPAHVGDAQLGVAEARLWGD